MKRYENTCSCSGPRIEGYPRHLPIGSCGDDRYEEECNAYSFVVFGNTSDEAYNNEACRACDPDGKADMLVPGVRCYMCDSRRHVSQLFKFSDVSLSAKDACEDFYEQGQSGDVCLTKHCQAGFEVHDNICMSVDTARTCDPPRQNRQLSDYQIANLFRSALIIHYQCVSPNDTIDCMKYEKMSCDTLCAQPPTLYNSISPKNLTVSLQCIACYFDTMAFGKLSGQLMAHDIARVLFPKMEVFHIMLLNHDPFSGVTCTGGVELNPRTRIQIIEEEIVKIISQDSIEFYVSNKDPMIMTNTRGEPTVEMWAINCRPQHRNKNCSAKLTQDSLSHMNSCLKYELTDDISVESGAITLKRGKILKQGEFLTTDNGTMLVCVDLYDKLHSDGCLISWSAVSYFVLLTNLATPFFNI